jgi:TatD-related deoxyribonuclease
MMPILDNHLHLQPRGRGPEAMKEFRKNGGTHAILSHMPYDEVPIISGEDWAPSYDITIDLAKRSHELAGVKMFTTVGPYPVLIISLAEVHGIHDAKAIMIEGMEEAARYVREGRAIAIGEVGRPHFPVSQEIMDASNEILSHGMRLAKEAGCAIVIHAETATVDTMDDLGRMADAVGLPRCKVVKHYCGPLVGEESCGLVPSVLASRSNIAEALRRDGPFLLETDYMDDPDRPGAVLGVHTVPKRVKAISVTKEGESAMWKVCKETPEKTYGITVDL